jgi:pimeloyl-ACP methyl ester carboxylesterase
VPTFLLVHGAWHGAWCWESLIPRLRDHGHRATAIDLPAHGEDRSSGYRATLGRYTRRVREAASRLDEPPWLVGHSMGGVSITQAAHDAPQAFAGLLYLCAFVPLPGDRMLALARQDPDTLVPRHATIRPWGVHFDPGGMEEVFCGTCLPQSARRAATRLCREPLLPMLQALRGEGPAPGSLPRVYLECAQDRAISIGHQRHMAARAGIDRVVTLDTDHSPFLCAPTELALRLHEATLG